MKQVIIGGSIAATGAISGIRSIAPDDEIIVINGEGRNMYSRPMISYFLAGQTGSELSYPYPKFAEENRVALINDWATAINRKEQQITLKNGLPMNYDRLLLATGSAAINIDLPGNEKTRIYNFYTLGDAETVQQLASQVQTAVVIGSGLIGIKAAEALHSIGIKVTIVEREKTIMPRILPPVVATRAEQELARMGIVCGTDQEVAGFSEGQVNLTDGCVLPADLVIMAVGVKPNLRLAADCGLAVDRGIMVNELMQTSDPMIYAAGDVVQVTNLISGKSEIMALLPLAREQGWTAGINMAGGKQIYPGGVPLNAVKIGGLAIASSGISNDPVLSWSCWQQNDKYLELFARDNQLVGFIAINMPEVCGPLYNSLIRPINLDINDWQRFAAAPSLSNVPPTYWSELRRDS